MLFRSRTLQHQRVGIAGGDRTLGQSDAFTLDACASRIPGDPSAQCSADKSDCGSLIFQWECSFGCSFLYQSTHGCSYTVPGNAIPAGKYSFQVTIKSRTSNDKLASNVTVNVLPGALPPPPPLALPPPLNLVGEPLSAASECGCSMGTSTASGSSFASPVA